MNEKMLGNERGLTLDEWNSADWLNNYQNAFFDVNVEE